MSALLDLLAGVGAVLDTPGALVRNSLAGRNPFQGLFDPEERTTGRGLLEDWGILGENQEGLDAGDLAGFGVDVVVDPVNLLGGAGLLKMLKARKPNIPVSVASELDEGYSIARALGAEGDELGRVTLMPPLPGESGAAFRGFPGVVPEGSRVARVEGSILDDAVQGRGVGQQMYVDAMNTSPAEWFYNSGNSDAATRAIEALREKGLADVHWQRRPGGPRVMRLTDEGRGLAGTGNLIRDPAQPPVNRLLAALLGYNALQGGF